MADENPLHSSGNDQLGEMRRTETKVQVVRCVKAPLKNKVPLSRLHKTFNLTVLS